MPASIEREELRARLAGPDRPTLVEALPERYWRAEHLPGALNLPHDRVDALADGLLPDKAAPIVVYCASRTCPNSRIAARRLEALGYSRVEVYEAGKQDWMEAGLPVEKMAG
jgi:rhodanese-related sulfurtransferase